MNIPPILVDYTLRSGKWFFVFDVFLLAANFWSLFSIPIVWLDVLWVYLLFNTLAIAAIVYRRYSFKPSTYVCPYCHGQLTSKAIYICPKCGELKPEK